MKRAAPDALARARLADDPERLATADRERETVDGVDDAVRGWKLDDEVLDLEQRLADRHW
jgi:hypothetical protein